MFYDTPIWEIKYAAIIVWIIVFITTIVLIPLIVLGTISPPTTLPPPSPYVLDTITETPYLAVSLNKLYSASTKSINVLRKSDSVRLDIGFLANGTLDTVTLLNFINSSDVGYVMIWYDQSGSNNHLTAPFIGVAPLIVNGALTTARRVPGVLFVGLVNLKYYTLQLPSTMPVGYVSMAINFQTGYLLSNQYINNWNAGTNNVLTSPCSVDVCGGNSIGTLNNVAYTPASNTPLASRNNVIYSVQTSQASVGTSWDNIGQDRIYNHFNGLYMELIVFNTSISVVSQVKIYNWQAPLYLVSS